MPKFIHADLIAQYAQDAAECSEPWKYWQYWFRDEWADAAGPINFHPNVKYRHKPKAILINGYEVPEPVREPPEDGQEYWLANVADRTARNCMWRGDGYDYKWFAAGLIHLSEEAAQIHIDALLSFTRRGE